MNVTSVDLGAVLEQTTVWVFGYGSLMWKTDFSYSRKEVGFIRGYKRRFWQGNETHRGSKHRRGRVATLLQHSKGKVWGVAFQIQGKSAIESALTALCTREMTLGGYIVTSAAFSPRDPERPPMHVLVFMATKENSLYLGRAPVSNMASEIVQARGTAGPNTDYVTNLADYVRLHIPEDEDNHLFNLDHKVRELKHFIYMDSTLWTKLSGPHPLSVNADQKDTIDSDNCVEYKQKKNVTDITSNNVLHFVYTNEPWRFYNSYVHV